MNFQDYLDILESEGLEESPLSDGLLLEAMKMDRQIKMLDGYPEQERVLAAKKLTERKIKCIWEAIEFSRLYKGDPDMHLWAKREFERQNKREFKGFRNELRYMTSNKTR